MASFSARLPPRKRPKSRDVPHVEEIGPIRKKVADWWEPWPLLQHAGFFAIGAAIPSGIVIFLYVLAWYMQIHPGLTGSYGGIVVTFSEYVGGGATYLPVEAVGLALASGAVTYAFTSYAFTTYAIDAING